MKLYKLLKDLPLVKAGRIVELEKSNWGLDIYTIFWEYANSKVELWKIQDGNISEWLEEIKESKSVWDLQEWDIVYELSSQWTILKQKWNRYLYQTNTRKNGNIFLTHEEVEEENDRRQAIIKIQRYCQENYIDNTWKGDKLNFFFVWDTQNDTIITSFCKFEKQFSPIGYFSYDDSTKILKQFPEDECSESNH